MSASSSATSKSRLCNYCYLDIDIDNHRAKLAAAAAFVDATDSRYGFSSKDLRKLGGSEVSRIEDLIATDHEWASKNTECGGVQIRPPPSGNRIVVRLLWDVAPLACENFATLCMNGSASIPSIGGGNGGGKEKKPKPPPLGECGKPLTYRESTIHRIVPEFIMQGGDFVFGNGSGGESVFGGKKFKDERAGLALKHDRRGVLSMGNSGKNSNTSQFFITFQAAPQCDGKHVVFGEVVSGFEVLDAAEKVGISTGEPSVPVTITDCGAFLPLLTPGSGYWYDQPDPDSYIGHSPVFMVRPRVVILAPNKGVIDKFRSALGTYATATFGIAVDDEGEGSDEGAVVVGRVTALLETYAVDVVVVAPACSGLVQSITELPPSWTEVDGVGSEFDSVEEVILTAKPVEAMMAIRTKSWVGRRPDWQLDGQSAS